AGLIVRRVCVRPKSAPRVRGGAFPVLGQRVILSNQSRLRCAIGNLLELNRIKMSHSAFGKGMHWPAHPVRKIVLALVGPFGIVEIRRAIDSLRSTRIG